jgi:large subunit ribosomal protein L22
MAVRAMSKGVRISPRKVSVVAALVRGRTVADALTILDHTPRRAAAEVRDAVKSAQANAEHNHSYKPGSLFVSQISVTAGPRLKRWRPAAQGRARPYQRKTSHILVMVDGEKRSLKKSTTAVKTDQKETS